MEESVSWQLKIPVNFVMVVMSSLNCECLQKKKLREFHYFSNESILGNSHCFSRLLHLDRDFFDKLQKKFFA